MKTICFNTPAAWLLAGLAILMASASTPADDAGRVRVSDFGDDARSGEMTGETEADLVVRGASSELRRRNAQTSTALKAMLQQQYMRQASARQMSARSRSGQRPVQQAASAQRPAQQAAAAHPAGMSRPVTTQGRPVQAVSHEGTLPAPPAVGIAPPGAVLAPPIAGCAPDCCPATCCPPAGCCAPCCPPQACCPPACCAPPTCCPPSCGYPAGDCCCPPGECCPGTCDAGPVGHYRISDCCAFCGGDGCPECRGRRGAKCRHGHHDGGCPICDSTSCLNNNCCADFLSVQAAAYRARNRQASANFNQYAHCRLGYFIPSGNGGIGSPIFGTYEVVYPVDPGYFDERDGEVYAAQGYGGAVSVPLAPIVGHTYNYGWGIPSSRLTPVSNTTP